MLILCLNERMISVKRPESGYYERVETQDSQVLKTQRLLWFFLHPAEVYSNTKFHCKVPFGCLLYSLQLIVFKCRMGLLCDHKLINKKFMEEDVHHKYIPEDCEESCCSRTALFPRCRDQSLKAHNRLF